MEWNIGETAGLLCHQALAAELTPRVIQADAEHTKKFQRALEERGVELRWPENLNLEDGDPHAHAR